MTDPQKDVSQLDMERYYAAMKECLTGAGLLIEAGAVSPDPKHLRNGIDSAHASVAALARLLIERGIFTEDEYMAANALAMEDEAKRYRAEVAKHLGVPVEQVRLA